MIESKDRQARESKNSQNNTKQIIDSKPTSSVRESRESKPIDSDSVCARSGGNGGLAPIDDTNLPQANCNEIIDSLLTLKIINGGYKEKYWSYGEGVEEKEIEEEIEEKIDISQGILIASIKH